MNQWRSPTAEKIYSHHHAVIARSAGTNKSAKRQLKPHDIDWADVICVMENQHKQRILQLDPQAQDSTDIYVLDIPDDYQFMDPALIDELQDSVDNIINDYLPAG